MSLTRAPWFVLGWSCTDEYVCCVVCSRSVWFLSFPKCGTARGDGLSVHVRADETVGTDGLVDLAACVIVDHI